jgi:hypothetical protein
MEPRPGSVLGPLGAQPNVRGAIEPALICRPSSPVVKWPTQMQVGVPGSQRLRYLSTVVSCDILHCGVLLCTYYCATAVEGFRGCLLVFHSYHLAQETNIGLPTAIQAIAGPLAFRPILSCRVPLESGAHYQVIGLLAWSVESGTLRL